MILINLLPQEFRKERSQIHRGPLPSSIRWILLVGSVLFLSLTFFNYSQYLLSLERLSELKKRWPIVQEEVKRINKIKSDIENGSKKEKEFLESYVTPFFLTTTILAGTSKYLPDSMWLVELKLTRKRGSNTFLLKGLALPSEGSSSIQEIEEYLRLLKEQFPKNTDLILTTSRQQKDEIELTLFTAIFKWP